MYIPSVYEPRSRIHKNYVFFLKLTEVYQTFSDKINMFYGITPAEMPNQAATGLQHRRSLLYSNLGQSLRGEIVLKALSRC